MKQKTTVVRRKVRRRTRAQVEADRRLTSLRKNLAKEIEADFDRFSGDKPSVTAGLLVLAKMRIILAFLQAFFPMFITAPKPRKIKKNTARRGRVKRAKVQSGSGVRRVKERGVSGQKKRSLPKGIRVVRLQQAQPESGVESSGLASDMGNFVVDAGASDCVGVDTQAIKDDAVQGPVVEGGEDAGLIGRHRNTEQEVVNEVLPGEKKASGENELETGSDPFSTVSRKSGKTYFLHSRLQKLKNGKETTLYYFSTRAGEGAIGGLPAGYEVFESEKTGLPLLKKAKQGDLLSA